MSTENTTPVDESSQIDMEDSSDKSEESKVEKVLSDAQKSVLDGVKSTIENIDNPQELESVYASERTKKLDLAIGDMENKIRISKGQVRSNSILLIILSVVTAVLYLQAIQLESIILWIIVGILGLLDILVLLSVFGSQTRVYKSRSELERLFVRKRIESHFPENVGEKDSDSQSYFDNLVKINIENLSEYYSLVKTHTNNSFRVSILSGIIGFFFITFGLVVGFSYDDKSPVIPYISAGAGVFIEFIAGVFFYLYNRTVRQLKSYHDSLLDVQNILLAFKIVEDIHDQKDRGTMITNMLQFLMVKNHIPNQDDGEKESKVL